MKNIGIVGCSAEGAALCYRTICLEAGPLMGRHNHPELTLHTIPLAGYMAGGDEDTLLPALDSTGILARAALQFALA